MGLRCQSSFRQGNAALPLRARRATLPRQRAFRLGFPASIEQSARALGLTVLTFLIASFGTQTVAAYGV